MARPTEYKDEYVEIAHKYTDSATPENMEIPTIEGLSELLHCDDETIGLWAKVHPEFSATIKRLKAAQKRHLMLAGMFGGKEVNASMAIFLLKNNHGMKDRSDVTTNDHDLPIPLLGGQSKDHE